MPDNHESFMKSLFCGGFHEEIVFPYPEMDAEEVESLDLIKESISKFIEEKVDSVKIDEEGMVPEEVIQSLRELGMFGLVIPEEYGGFGLSQTAYSKVLEHLGGLDGSLALIIGAHSSIGLKGIILFGSEEQKRRFLPKLATGELIAAYALTEPGSGSDAGSLKSRAVYDAESDVYTVSGNKIWITNGSIAGLLTAFVKTEVEADGETKDKISAFIVLREPDGFTSGKEEKKMGIRGSSTTEINFDDIRVPSSQLLGDKGRGFKVAMEILNSGRLGLAAGSVGGMKTALKLATTHTLEREQFGRPIAEFEMIKEKIAYMAMETFVAESMAYLTTGLVDRGGIDFSLESSICKIYSSEALWRVVNEAMQIAAGIGYMKEYPYERIMRDSRINMIFEGTNEILRLFVALSGMQDQGEYLKKLGKALRDPIKGFGLLTDYAFGRIKRTVTAPEITMASPILEEQVDRVREYVRTFQGNVEGMLIKHGKGIIERELVLKRLADIAIDLYAMIATISRVTSIIESKGEEKSAPEIAIAKAFCEDTWRRVRRNSAMTRSNQDSLLNDISGHIYKSEGYKLG